MQSQKPVGDVQAVEMRVTANTEVKIELGEIIVRSVLCRDPMVGLLFLGVFPPYSDLHICANRHGIYDGQPARHMGQL